jgi:Methyltransferase domain
VTASRIKRIVPVAGSRWLRRRHRNHALRRGLRSLASGQPWADLVHGWGNEEWSALPEYLEAVASYCRGTSGPILECGSGLTTLVLASLTDEVYALEHDLRWRETVEAKLSLFGLSAHVVAAPLRSYGAFDWYDVDVATLPTFSLVVCDGPPAETTKGGRYGLLPVMIDRLADGCTILLDDADRPSEREALGRWAESLAAFHTYGRTESYAVATLGPRPSINSARDLPAR